MEGAFIESRVLAILVTFCCCLIALQVWFDSIPRWRGEAQSPSGRLFSTPLHLVLRNLMPVSSPKTKLAIANAALYLSGIGIAYFFIVGGNQRGTDDFILPCCTSFLLFIILLSYVKEKNRLMNIVEPTDTYTLLTGIGSLGLVISLFLLWSADSDNPDPWIGFYCFSSMILIIIPFLALSRPSPLSSTPDLKAKKPATRRKLKGYETLVLYESPELEEVINDINLHLRTFGHYVMFIQIYMAGVDGKVTRDETETLEVHKDELIQGMINAGAASEWTADSYLDEAISDARSLYNKYQQTGKLDIGYAVCIRTLTTLAQGIGTWSGPPGTRPAGPHLKAAYSFLNDIALADGDLDFGESEALQFADSEWSSVPGYAQYNPYQ